jgi:predicted ATPase
MLRRMITSVRLQNWTSFGALQTAPLEAITVLVGANNSGKSNFLRALRSFEELPTEATVHRPASKPALVARGLTADVDGQEVVYDFKETYAQGAGLIESTETLLVDGAIVTAKPTSSVPRVLGHPDVDQGYLRLIAALFVPLRQSRLVHLKADAIRPSNQLAAGVTIQPDGGQLAALIARWTLELPERREELNAILQRCLPEMKRVHAPPAPKSGEVRLVFEQQDGERFDADEVSDGVILFTALIAHALEAPENGLVLIEEPERGLHPRRLVELLDLLRTLVETRKTQFVLATHSASLLTLLRDEIESILLFRRTDAGTEIRPLSDVPELAETLTRADPGELLASGAFNEGFRREMPDVAAE